jgi:hypothetical protein
MRKRNTLRTPEEKRSVSRNVEARTEGPEEMSSAIAKILLLPSRLWEAIAGEPIGEGPGACGDFSFGDKRGRRKTLAHRGKVGVSASAFYSRSAKTSTLLHRGRRGVRRVARSLLPSMLEATRGTPGEDCEEKEARGTRTRERVVRRGTNGGQAEGARQGNTFRAPPAHTLVVTRFGTALSRSVTRTSHCLA